MALFPNLFHKKEVPIVIELAESPSFVEDMAKPKTETNPLPEKRVDRTDLEITYRAVPVCYNSVNKTVTLISKGYNLPCLKKNGEVDKKSQDFFDEKFSKIAMDDIIKFAAMHDCIFGVGYTEKRYNNGESKLVNFRMVDPKFFDYEKDTYGNIVIDEGTQEPKGYAQQVGADVVLVNKKYIIQHNLYRFGSGLQPIGLIEPAFKTILRKLHIEEALSESLYRIAHPSILIKVGTKEVPPRADSLKKITEQYKKARHSSVYIYPYTQEISTLEANLPDGVVDMLNYFTNEIITAMGVPKSFAYASSGDTAQKSVKVLGANFMRTIESMEHSLSKEFEPSFIEMANLEGIDTPPKFMWNPVERDDIDAKAKRFVSYAKSGLISPALQEKLMIEILKMEGIKLQ